MKKTVAVLFGGRSAEHEISIITGLEVLEVIDTEHYDAIPVYIDASGRWFTGERLLDREWYRGLPESRNEVQEVALLPVPGLGGLSVVPGKKGRGLSLFGAEKPQVIAVDVFFPAFHGQLGEDGCIQGLFEMADVVYTGCGVLASAVAMNKYFAKSMLHAHGIAVLPAVVVNKADAKRGLKQVRETVLKTQGLGEFPLFVKPVNLGSSVAVSRVSDEVELDAALAKVFQHDLEALVEPCVTDLMEINVSVTESASGPQTSVCEVPVASSGVLTYEDKYLRGGGKKGKLGGRQRLGMAGLTRVIDPENLPESIKDRARSCACEAYRVLGCAGVVRFDFIVDTGSDTLYFNELNPLPGSMAHYLWAESNPKRLYPELITEMIERAIARKELQSSLKREMGFRALFA